MDVKDYLQDILNPDSDMTMVLSSLMCIVEQKNADGEIAGMALENGICPDCWEEMDRFERKDGSEFYLCKYCEFKWEVE
jgi:hypothetical protein